MKPTEAWEKVRSAAPVMALSPSESKARITRGEVCRRSFARYVRAAWSHLPHLADTTLEWNWHHDALCSHLQVMAEEWAVAKDDPTQADVLQRIRNLLINIAPGTTKTLITLVFFPTWMWTRWPRWTVRCVSSNPRSIQESSDFARQIVTSDWYKAHFIPTEPDDGQDLPAWARAWGLEPWEVREDKNALSDWGNTLGGSRRSTGFQAAITGEHTDWILCDDPHDAEKVHSVEERQNVVTKWDDAIYNRVNDGRVACRVVVMQRLRVDDLAGHIIEHDLYKVWCRLVIASEYEPDNTFASPIGWQDPRTEKGQLLDPIRFPRRKLDEELARLGPSGFAAQHQQRPDADSQVAFKLEWWNWYVRPDRKVHETWRRPEGARQEPAFVLNVGREGMLDVDWVCVSVDCTGGSTKEAASAVGLIIVAGKAEKRFVLDDCTPGPRSFLQQVDDMKQAVAKAVRITGKRSIRLLVEEKMYGGAAMEVIDKEIKNGDFALVDGRPVALHVEPYKLKPGMGSKVQRAQGLEPDLFSGVIYLPEGAPWLPSFLAEFKRHPVPPNDRVDTLVQVIERYRKRIGWAEAFKKVGR